jgi:dihydroorotase
MKVLLKQVRIIHPQSPLHQSVKDVFIENGIFSAIQNNISQPASTVIEGEGLFAAPGFMDLFSHFGDPGLEHKETLATGSQAALAGGYTDIALLPNTQPAIHNKTGVDYLKQQSATLPVHLHPLGAVTRNTEGKELAEMIDMNRAGAVAFTDGVNGIQQGGLLLKALQYVKAFNGVVIQLPGDKSISANGLMNEGITSTRLGLPGTPALAEELMIHRDIELCRYTQSKIHFTGVSSAGSLSLIRKAKAEGIQVTCSVTPHHLHFCDEDLAGYNTYLKVNPPLRTAADRAALREALLDGTIDCVATHHLPHEHDAKQCEFEYAQYGMEGLESTFGALAALPGITPQRIVELISLTPRSILNMEAPGMAEGAAASLTLFSMHENYTFTAQHIRSRSVNNGFTGQPLKGNIKAVIHKNQLHL